MALPQGLWPKNRALASKGSWTDPKTGKTVNYSWPVVFEVDGGPMRSPYDPAFNPGSTPRIQVIGNAIETNMNKLEASGNRSEEHTSELQSLRHLVCRLLLEK